MVSSFKLATAVLLATLAMATPHDVHHRHHHIHERSKGGKRGACYDDASLLQPLSHAVSWAYDWNMLADGILPDGVEYVPMLWGSKMFGGWFSSIETALSGGSQYILGFNEPDIQSQANMSPAEAVSAYHNYVTPYAGKATLVSPAVTSAVGPGLGLDWLRQFMDSCSDCNIGALAIHWYGETADDFKNYVSQAIDLGKKYNIDQIWVTEFALSSAMDGGAPAQSAAFLKKVMPWLDKHPNVARYAYFMASDGYLLSGSSLSASGQVYASL